MEDSSHMELLTTDQVEEVSRGTASPGVHRLFLCSVAYERFADPQLVLTLYQPNHPQTIASTQATLTKLQASPRAWAVARDLLARSDEKVKFHGALIIIIKLNTER